MTPKTKRTCLCAVIFLSLLLVIVIIFYFIKFSFLSFIIKRVFLALARKGISLIISFFGVTLFSTLLSVLPDLNLPLPPAEVPPLPPVEVPPLTPEEIQDVDEKIKVRRRIERWLQLIYQADGRPKVEDEMDFHRMANFFVFYFDDESLEEHEAVLLDLEKWGSSSRYYEKFMDDWFGEKNQRVFNKKK